MSSGSAVMTNAASNHSAPFAERGAARGAAQGGSAEIVLATLNARYIHSAFGLRYLMANLGSLQDCTIIKEFALESRPADVVETLLRSQPKIIGLGVYIWNLRETEKVVALLKTVAPEVQIVLGGPEVSYEQAEQRIVAQADYVISGWGEHSFKQLAEEILGGQPPTEKFIAGVQPKLAEIAMPYALYTDEDIRQRVLYVEASRGCPFKCEFCLSALDKTAWPFDLDEFLAHMRSLYERGARHFKFVDRTFNLKIKSSLRILEFFLSKMGTEAVDDTEDVDGGDAENEPQPLFLHFEVVPDHLPDALKAMLQRFPRGTLQFEVGIQTFNPEVQARISRRQNNQAATDNLRWLREHTQAHIHADLIFGLPGESLGSFAESFNTLYALRPHEIQVGILKRLKGSPIIRHTEEFGLKFNPEPPFNIVASHQADFATVQRIQRFARFWDLIGNSGRFKHSLPMLLSNNPFQRFLNISDQIFAASEQTHKISLLRLFDLLHNAALQTQPTLQAADLHAALLEALQKDFAQSGLKSTPKCLQQLSGHKQSKAAKQQRGLAKPAHGQRQSRH